MTSTRFGYVDDTPVTVYEMESYVNAAVATVSQSDPNAVTLSQMQTYVDSVVANIDSTDPNAVTLSQMQTYVDSAIASVNTDPTVPDPDALTYKNGNPTSGQFPVFTGVGNQVTKSSVLTTLSNGDLQISGDVTFQVTGRTIGEPLTPVAIIYTKRITTLDQLKIDAKTITLAEDCELVNFKPFQYYPSNIPYVFERVIFTINGSFKLSTPNTSTNYLDDFKTYPLYYGSLTLPVLSLDVQTTLRFRVQGAVYSQTTSNHKINLVASASQDPNADDPDTRFMSLIGQGTNPDVSPVTDGGVERAFEWNTIMRFPFNDDKKRVGLFAHSMMTVANHSTGSMIQDWSEGGGAAGQRMNTAYPFRVNLGLAWDQANANKYIVIHQCTVTMSPF